VSLVADIADAVTAEINGATLGAFTAARVYRPQFTLEQLAALTVTVVPGPIERERLARGSNVQKTYTVGVSVQQKVEDETNASIDPLVALAEQIADVIGPGEIGATGAQWVRTDHEPLYDPDHMRDHQVFTNVVLFTFQTFT
jgi:hypothetical protein